MSRCIIRSSPLAHSFKFAEPRRHLLLDRVCGLQLVTPTFSQFFRSIFWGRRHHLQMERAPGVGEHRALSIIPSSPEPAAVNGPELVSALYNNDMNLKLKKISAKQARKAEAQRAQHLPPPHRHHDKEEDLQLRSQWSRLLDGAIIVMHLYLLTELRN